MGINNLRVCEGLRHKRINMVFVEYLPRINTTNVYTNINENIEEIGVTGDILSILDCQDPILLTHDVKNYTYNISDGPNGKIIRLKEVGTRHDIEEIEYHWTSKELQSHHYIRCSSCSSDLIEISQLRKVLPMPSEMWNEMVDFWHCHKPNGSDVVTKRFNGLKPGQNGILVGSHYFVFNPEDFETIKVVNDNVHCGNCNYLLGTKDQNFGCYKLLKWRVKLDEKSYEKWRYVYSALIEEVQFTGAHKFTLLCSDRYIKIWCFGLGIEMVIEGVKYNNAMKILFSEIEERKEGEYTIEIEYEEVFDDFIEHLRKFNKELEKYGLEYFNKWKVGYIGNDVKIKTINN